MVSDAMAFLPEHVHLGEKCAWHGTRAACEARGLCSACKEPTRRYSNCSGYCSNNLYPDSMKPASGPEVRCVWCGTTGYGKECPPCEVEHEGEPFPTEAGGDAK